MDFLKVLFILPVSLAFLIICEYFLETCRMHFPKQYTFFNRLFKIMLVVFLFFLFDEMDFFKILRTGFAAMTMIDVAIVSSVTFCIAGILFLSHQNEKKNEKK